MNTSISLYGFAGSTYLRTVAMVCLHKGIHYTLKPLEFREASHRQLHPFLKMPVMEHNRFVLYESLAICQYLEDLVPEPALIPQAMQPKALTLQWVTAFIDYLAPVLIRARPEDETQSWPAITAEYLTILEQRLSVVPFLAGDQPTLADLYLSPAIDYALGGPGFDQMLATRPGLMDWWQRASGCQFFEQTQAA